VTAPDPERAPGFEAALFTDLYELTMLRAYHAEGLTARAAFSLYVRDLPPERNFLIAAGLEDVLDYLERLAFSAEALEHLRSLPQFDDAFVNWLARLRFTGDVHAIPEGTPVFAGEPLLEVEAPIAEAQLVETYLLNQITFQTLIASKGARVVAVAGGKPVIDFGTRRTHGTDAALKAARALFLAGFEATSNVEAGRLYDIPVMGTMAHSYVQAHDDELDAFREFSRLYPGSVLLVDTYDTEQGVRHAIRVAGERRDSFTLGAVRLDSGDLLAHAVRARELLDEAGLQDISIVASGGLDEHRIAELECAGAPINSYAVGTRVGTSADTPLLESVYKLVAYRGTGRSKRSEGKATLPGRKQVFRRAVMPGGEFEGDVIAAADESLEGEPLLQPVMLGGRRLQRARPLLRAVRSRTAAEIARLPVRLRALEPASPPYPVTLSERLSALGERRA